MTWRRWCVARQLRYADLMPPFRLMWLGSKAYVEIRPPYNHKLRRCVPEGMDGDKVMAEGRRRLDALIRRYKDGGRARVPLGTWRYVMGEPVPGYMMDMD